MICNYVWGPMLTGLTVGIANIESLCCTPETHGFRFQVNYTSTRPQTIKKSFPKYEKGKNKADCKRAII